MTALKPLSTNSATCVTSESMDQVSASDELYSCFVAFQVILSGRSTLCILEC